MKKKISFFFLLALLTAGGSLTAQTILMRIPDSTVVAGNNIDIPIYADNTLTGQGVYSYTLQLSFNQTALQVISVITTGTISNPFGSPAVNTTVAGKITMAAAGTTPLAGSGKFIYVRFKALQAGNSTISFTGTQYNYFNEGTPVMSFDNGNLNITSPPVITISPNSATIAKGEQVQFSQSGGTAPFQWSVTNPSVASISSSGLMTATNFGLTKAVVQDNNGFRDTTNGNIDIRAMRLSIPNNLSQLQGTDIDIPVITSTLTGLNVIAGSFTFSFNQNILTPLSIVQSGTLLSSYPAPLMNTSVPGRITIGFAGYTPLAGSGTLIFVRFHVSTQTSGTSSLTFIEGMFNETMTPAFTNGSFTTINLPSLSISPGTGNLVAGQNQQFALTGSPTLPVQWSVNDTSLASINQSGLVIAKRSGTLVVHAVDALGAQAASGNWILYDTEVTMPDTSVCPAAQYFNYPVLIKSMPDGQAVYSVQAKFTYDQTLLSFISVETTGTLTEGWAYATNPSTGQVLIAGSGMNSFSSAGTILKLKFQLNSNFAIGSQANVQLPTIILNEGVPSPLVDVNGKIRGVVPFTAGIGISASPQGPICEGSNIVFMAIPINVGLPLYQWKINGVNVNGANGATYTTSSLSNGSDISCEITTTEPCVSGIPLESNHISMIVLPDLPSEVNIESSSSVCEGNIVEFDALTQNGGNNPQFLWYVNEILVSSGSAITNGLSMYFPFSGNASDESGNNNNGIVSGATLTIDHDGNQNSAYHFNGSGNYINVPQVNWSAIGYGDFSIGAWVFPLTFSNYPMIIADNLLDNFQFNFRHGGGYYQLYLGGTLAGECNYFPFAEQTWYHLFVSRNAGVLSFYINGQLSRSITSNQYINQSSFLDIGFRTSNGMHPFNGSIDEIRIYDRALTALEIEKLYISSSGSNFSYLPTDEDEVVCKIVSDYACSIGDTIVSNSIIINVNTIPANPEIISGESTVYKGQKNVGYFVLPLPDVTGYYWTLPTGATIISGENTNSITVDFDSTAITGEIYVQGYNDCGIGPLSVPFHVTVNRQLNILLFLEGLYDGNGIMRKAQNEIGDHFSGTIADQVTIELHNSSNYSEIIFTSSEVNLNTNGSIILFIPAEYNGSYYITVKHRSSLETSSATPISFSGGVINYDYTDSVSKAYGDNLHLLSTKFCIYGGDVTLDGIVDGSDIAAIDNASTIVLMGYNSEDVNGDGIVDGSDMALIDNNATSVVQVKKP